MHNLVYLFVVSVIWGLLLGYFGNIQNATKWVGKKLMLRSDLYFGSANNPNLIQWQTFVTPPSQNLVNILHLVCFAVLVCFFGVVEWQFVGLAFLLVFIVAVLSRFFFPKRLDWYLQKVLLFIQKKKTERSNKPKFTKARLFK